MFHRSLPTPFLNVSQDRPGLELIRENHFVTWKTWKFISKRPKKVVDMCQITNPCFQSSISSLFQDWSQKICKRTWQQACKYVLTMTNHSAACFFKSEISSDVSFGTRGGREHWGNTLVTFGTIMWKDNWQVTHNSLYLGHCQRSS